mgnify:CR=1 FL=1
MYKRQVIDPTAGRMVLGDDVIYDNGWRVRDLRALRRDKICLLYTSDAADERASVDLGGRRILKKNKNK